MRIERRTLIIIIIMARDIRFLRVILGQLTTTVKPYGNYTEMYHIATFKNTKICLLKKKYNNITNNISYINI